MPASFNFFLLPFFPLFDLSLLIPLKHRRLEVIEILLAAPDMLTALFTDQRGNLGLALPALADDEGGLWK